MSTKSKFIQIKSFEEISSDKELFDLTVSYQIFSSLCGKIFKITYESAFEFEFCTGLYKLISKKLCDVVEGFFMFICEMDVILRIINSDKPIKIGIDFHGVIDAKPKFFSKLTNYLKDKDVEIHIITGNKHNDELEGQLAKFGIFYHKFFSIYDHLILNNKPVFDTSGNFWFESELWDSQKGIYCKENKIDFHFDDSIIYKNYFDSSVTEYILVEN